MIFESYQYNEDKYSKLENVLQCINRKFVSLNEDDVRVVNPTLGKFLNVMVASMRRVSVLFDNMFESILYGGSFYDGLKVGQPDEFDIDLKLRLPNILNVQIIPSYQPGFVHVFLQDWDILVRHRGLYQLYKDLDTLQNGHNYLLQSNVTYWMQQTVANAINLIIFEESLPNIRQDFYVVPKPPKPDYNSEPIYWRLSFQQQEQQLLNGYQYCKPALRLLKKLRDTRNHNIPSYFIKTIFLWKVEQEKRAFWNRSLNFVFMEMLETYKNCIQEGRIPYYWNENYNLLQNVKPDTIFNIKNFLQRMIDMIQDRLDKDIYITAKFLLPKPEYEIVYYHFNPTLYIPESAARSLTADEILYAQFEMDLNRPYKSGFTFSRFVICVAIVLCFYCLTKSNK